MSQLAEEAGVSVGTVYQYFPSKEALVAKWEELHLAQTLTSFEALCANFAPMFDAHTEIVPAHFYALVRSAIEFIVERTPRYAQTPGAYVFAGSGSHRKELITRAASTVHRTLAPIRAQLWPEDLELASLLVVELAVGLAFTYVAETPEDCACGAFQRELATMIARYLLARPGRDPYAG
jgi:AcrR family transcriptional regulator